MGKSREEYAAWQSAVIAAFWGKRGQSPGIVPKAGGKAGGKASAVRAVKSKTVVAADLVVGVGSNAYASARVAESEPDPELSTVFPKTKLMLYHAGLKRPDGVSAGLDAGSGTWFHPATDTGGLTNSRQKLGERAPFLRSSKGAPFAEDAGSRTRAADAVYEAWLDGREAFSGCKPSAKAALRLWVRSFPTEGPGSRGTLRVARFPKERRVIVHPREVLRVTGKYFVRVYGSDTDTDTVYAREATPAEIKKMFMAVSAEYVTPNLNIANLKNEYVAAGK